MDRIEAKRKVVKILEHFDHGQRRRRSNFVATLFLVLISLVLLELDYVTGPHIQIPFFYVLLVGLMAWFWDTRVAYVVAFALPLLRIGARFYWALPLPLYETSANALIQISALLLAALLVSKGKALILEVRTLRGNLRICPYCTRIYNERGKWEAIEQYLSRQSAARFTHDVCPECEESQAGKMLTETGVGADNV